MTRRLRDEGDEPADDAAASPWPAMRLNEAADPHTPARGVAPAPPSRTAAVSLGEQAYERLRRDIVQCRLAPGVEVTEAELAARYALGKAPVRVALTRLTQDGLVRPVPRRGYLVEPITLKDVQDLFDMRAIIEPALCRVAVGRLDPETLQQIEGPPELSGDPQRQDAHLEWNQHFHIVLASGSGNGVGTDMLAELLRRATRIIYLGLYAGGMSDRQMEAGRRESRREHKELIEAFARGDADEVEQLARKHVETSRRLALDALLQGRSTARV